MTSFVTYIFLLLIGAVFGLIWLILFIIGCVKKNKKRILLSFIPVGLFVFIAGGILASAAVKRHDFEKIPLLEVNNDTVTILGSTSSGSFGANYVIAEVDENGNIIVRNKEEKIQQRGMGNVFMTSDDSILTEIDHPAHLNHKSTKSGYTFKVNKPGTAYVCLFIREMANFSYLDIYKVVSDDNMTITADNIEHIECNDKFKDELPMKFSFLIEVFNELN